MLRTNHIAARSENLKIKLVKFAEMGNTKHNFYGIFPDAMNENFVSW